MPVENVILNIQGKEIDLDKVDKTKYINIPRCRIKIVIGYKDYETYKEFEKNYLSNNWFNYVKNVLFYSKWQYNYGII